jgi:hypothetical protein
MLERQLDLRVPPLRVVADQLMDRTIALVLRAAGRARIQTRLCGCG